jgi:hypothetical protein
LYSRSIFEALALLACAASSAAFFFSSASPASM